MKNFFTSLLGALVALIVFTLGGGLLLIGFIGAIAAMSEKTVGVDQGSYLVFDLSSAITDAPPVIDLRAFGSDHQPTLQLRTVTRTLRAAAQDDRIAGVFIKGDVPTGSSPGYGALKEVRRALLQFKASGKPVKTYLTYATTKNFYLASVADDVVLDPYGMIIMPGLAAQPMFLAGAFEKYGVGVQVTRVGKYKSAVEPFTRTDMSPENREQLQKLLNDMWGGLLNDIAASRKLKSRAIQATVDHEGLIRPEAAKAAGLVDRIAYRDQVIEEMKKLTGRGHSTETFKQISLADYSKVAKDVPPPSKREGLAKLGTPAKTGAAKTTDEAEQPAQLATAENSPAVAPDKADKTKAADAGALAVQEAKQAVPAEDTPSHAKTSGRGRVAVVYAEGSIVDGEGDEPGEIGGTRFGRELRRLRQDDSVKAIVLRVNSPGGSMSGSEAIQREIRLIKEVKPVIVSMGSYAASGGYWISAYADRIFAEPSTVTGSIGIFGIMFNVKQLANGFGVTFDTVKTGKFADALTITRPKTPEEMALVQAVVDWGYEQFIAKVADGRQLKREYVEEIAQGRVWSGLEAKKLGLVDELGGLDAAIRHAAQQAGLGQDYRLVEYPKKKEFAEALQEMFEKMAPNNARASGLVGQVLQRVETELSVLQSFNDPQGLYARLPENLMIE